VGRAGQLGTRAARRRGEQGTPRESWCRVCVCWRLDGCWMLDAGDGSAVVDEVCTSRKEGALSRAADAPSSLAHTAGRRLVELGAAWPCCYSSINNHRFLTSHLHLALQRCHMLRITGPHRAPPSGPLASRVQSPDRMSRRLPIVLLSRALLKTGPLPGVRMIGDIRSSAPGPPSEARRGDKLGATSTTPAPELQRSS